MKLSIAIKSLLVVFVGIICAGWPADALAADDAGDANFLYAQLGGLYDSNVFRVSSLSLVPSGYHANGLSDLIAVTTVGGQYQKMLGKEQIQLSGSYNQNSYTDYSELDYKSWNVNGEFDWQPFSQLTGIFRYSDKQEQPSLNVSDQVGRDVVRTQVGGIDLIWMPISTWQFETGVQHSTMRHQVESSLDYDQDALSAVAWYATPKGTRFGVSVEQGDITYPTVQMSNGEYEYRQINSKLQFEWPVTAKLKLSAMVGNSAVRFRQNDLPDRNHAQQDVNLLLTMSSKATLTLGYDNSPIPPGLSMADVLNKYWYLVGKINFSDKFLLSAEIRQTKLYYLSSDVLVNTRSYRVGLQWMPWRMWQVDAYGQVAQRLSGFADDSYDVNQLGLNLKYSF